MSILSWLFPSDDDRLRAAKDLMARGRYEDARRGLLQCQGPEAEKLYETCSQAVDREVAASLKKQARAEGFRGWKVEVAMKSGRDRARFEAIIAAEIARARVDLDAVEVDQAAVQAAIKRAEQKARNKGIAGAVTLKLVPVMAGSPAAR